MIPNSKAFNGNSSFEYDGKTFYRWYPVRKDGAYQLCFRIVSTNSPHKQGIALFFSDFKGKLWLNDGPLPVLKGKFKHYTFKADDISERGLTLSACSDMGHLTLGNASETVDGGFECGAFGCAFWIETLAENKLRFHCNDHEMDDDFDDLIFDLEIIEMKFY